MLRLPSLVIPVLWTSEVKVAATSAPTTMDTEKVKIKAIIKRNTVTKEELLHRKLDKRV